MKEVFENSSSDDLISRSVLNEKLKKWKLANEERGYDTAKDLIQEMIDIVKEQQSVSENDGWIPCSERLPEKNGNYLVQIEESDGTAVLSFMDVEHCNSNGVFLHDYNGKKNYRKVVAWQPLPEKYQTKGE